MSKKINIITLGCSKNLVDSERLMKQLIANEFTVVHDSDERAHIVIINTCGFIGDAKEESINTILHYCKEKKRKRIEQLFVIGCLSERYADSLRTEIPEVDAYFGTKDINKILQLLNATLRTGLLNERIVTTPAHTSYLKIAEGCNRTCAFCSIPLIRGKYESRSVDELIEEARFLTQQGVRELSLIAQDLSFYGLDTTKRRMLPELVNRLHEIDDLRWIRLHYTYPNDFPEEVLSIMKNSSKVCHYLDIPFQHISNNMLNLMRRNISKEQTITLINKFRDAVPDIALRTSMLVGHPGETEDDFEELLQFVQDTKFDRLGVFKYSHEEDTYAYKNYEDTIDDEIKQQRADDLMAIQQGISLSLNQARIGKQYEILVDRHEAGNTIARTQFDSYEVDNEVIIPNKELPIGSFHQALITDAAEFDLTAQIIE